MAARVVAFKESSWGDVRTDFRQWDNLCRAYGVELTCVDDWSEVDDGGLPIVLLDEVGTERLSDFVHPVDCIYVFGRTGIPALPTIITPHAASVRVETPQPISGMFGATVAGAVLFDRMIKG